MKNAIIDAVQGGIGILYTCGFWYNDFFVHALVVQPFLFSYQQVTQQQWTDWYQFALNDLKESLSWDNWS